MKKNEIRVGGVYVAKVSGKLTKVRVDSISEVEGFRASHLSGMRSRRDSTSYSVTNLTTKRTTSFRSASKFRQEVKETAMPVPGQKSKSQSEKVAEQNKAAVGRIKESQKANGELLTRVAKGELTAGQALQQVGKKGHSTPASKEVQSTLIHGTGPARGLPDGEDEVFPLDDADEKRVVAQRKAKTVDPSKPVEVDHAMYAEIAAFEAKVKHPWWKFAHKNESWASYKARGCPLSLPLLAPLIADGPPVPGLTALGTPAARNATQTHERTPKANSLRPKEIAVSEPVQSVREAKPAVPAKPKAPRAEGAPSNKEIVYKEWLKVEGTPDPVEIAKLVPEVSLSSVKSWFGMWAKGNGLPACSKDLPPSLKGTYGKPVKAEESKPKPAKKGKK